MEGTMTKSRSKSALVGGFFAGALALSVATPSKADTIYTVDLAFGAASVTGTITTDGTIGVLDIPDVTSWNLVLNDGKTTIHLPPLHGLLAGLFFDLICWDHVDENCTGVIPRTPISILQTSPHHQITDFSPSVLQISPYDQMTVVWTRSLEIASPVPGPIVACWPAVVFSVGGDVSARQPNRLAQETKPWLCAGAFVFGVDW
jgi:hypothetical protein